MSKYKNRKVLYNGMVFDSKKERDRWIELTAMQKTGQISNLKRQVEYLLIPAQFGMVVENGKRKRVCLERACSYIADFTYNKGGEFVCEDVKGGYKKGTHYSLFVIKRKLMLERFGIRVVEV